MLKDQIIKNLKDNKNKLAPYHIKSMALFGSVARGEETPESDIDLMIEFDGPSTFDNLMRVRFILEEVLGSQVDLITQRGIRPEILPTIQKEAIYVS